MEKENIIVFGETNFRNRRDLFGIKTDDRRRHMYIIGKTGMGKTELLKNMAIQDIQEGRGLAFVDPHGDISDSLLDYIPKERVKDVIYFNPTDLDNPIAFNIMEKVEPKHRHLVASNLLGVFKKIWQDMWSARMEYILLNAILALLEVEGGTLLGVNRMFSDKEFRKNIVSQVTDPLVKSFWENEFARYTERLAVEAVAAIQNKVGQFISSSLIRNIIGQQKTSINIRKAMDEGKILILNLARGRIGEDASRLLGALLITKVQLAAMSRIDIPEEERKDFYLYVDEFQHFATESFVNILSEARKFRLNLIIAHQYISQMEENVRDAVFGNVGTIITFRVGAEDAEVLEKEFAPEFELNDIVNLPKWNIYLKLMIDGVASNAFSAGTLVPFPALKDNNREEIIEFSRKTYGTPRHEVEEKIATWIETSFREDRRDMQTRRDGAQSFPDRTPRYPSSRKTFPAKSPDSFGHTQGPRYSQKREYGNPAPRDMSLQELSKRRPMNLRGKEIERKAEGPEYSRREENKKTPIKPDIEGLRSILKKVGKR